MLSNTKKYFIQKHFTYIYVGIWNTIFGFLTGIVVYKFTIQSTNIIFVGVISNIVSISMSFLTYKFIVFKTTSNWVREYLKCYIVYGVMALLSIFLLWVFVSHYGLNIWLAQGLIVVVTSTTSYLSHKKFTFKTIQNEK
jgi:putative flippase GtrA